MKLDEMKQAVIDGDVDRAHELAREALRQGDEILTVVDQGFAAGIRRVGELWEEGEYFLPELVQGAEAMKAAMSVLTPALAAGGGPGSKGRIVIGTVEGDLHDIGKSLVATLLSANGFEVHDLGPDTSVQSFVDKAREVEADLVGASALLTTTMTAQAKLVAALKEAALPKTPEVMVGGAPCSTAWAEEIGAHYAENALQAVELARSLVA